MFTNLVTKFKAIDPSVIKKAAVIAGAAVGTVIVAIAIQRAASQLNGLVDAEESPFETEPLSE